jgi:hypothetical protein
MRKSVQWLDHELSGLDDDNEDDVNSLTLIVAVLIFVVPTVAIVMGAAFAAYFSA